MAIGTATAIGLGLAGIGSFMNARQGNKNAKQAQAYGQQQQQYLQGIVPQGPTGLEQMGVGMLGGLGGPMQIAAPQQISGGFDPQMFAGGFNPQQATMDYTPELLEMGFTPQMFDPTFQAQQADIGNMLSGSGFNTGQDAIMQMLRADPRTQVDASLEGIANNGGNTFDTSALFGALGQQDALRLEDQLSAQRGSFAGLGSRFGSHANIGESRLRQGALADTGARNAMLGMQAHEAGQGRVMNSLGMLTGREQFNTQSRLQGGQALQQGGLAAAGLGLQGVQANNQANLMGQQLAMQAAQQNNAAGLSAAQLQAAIGGQNNAALQQQAILGLQANQQNNAFGLDAAQLGLAGTQANNAANQANAVQMLQAALANQGAGLQQQGLQLQSNQGQQQTQAQLLQMLLGAQNSRMGLQGQLGMAAGQAGAPVGAPGYGDTLGGIGNILAMAGMMGGQKGGAKKTTVRQTGLEGFNPSILQMPRRAL